MSSPKEGAEVHKFWGGEGPGANHTAELRGVCRLQPEEALAGLLWGAKRMLRLGSATSTGKQGRAPV